jgi:hypothetical protein
MFWDFRLKQTSTNGLAVRQQPLELEVATVVAEIEGPGIDEV